MGSRAAQRSSIIWPLFRGWSSACPCACALAGAAAGASPSRYVPASSVSSAFTVAIEPRRGNSAMRCASPVCASAHHAAFSRT